MNDATYKLDARSFTYFGLAVAMLATVGNAEPIWAKFLALGGVPIYILLGAVTINPASHWQVAIANMAGRPSVFIGALSVGLWSVGFAAPLSSLPGFESISRNIHAGLVWLSLMLIVELIGARVGLRPGQAIVKAFITARQKRFLSLFTPVMGIAMTGAWLFGENVFEPRTWQFLTGASLIFLALALGVILGRFLDGKLESING